MTGHDLAAPLNAVVSKRFLKCRRKTHPSGLAAEWHPRIEENACDILARDHVNCT
jgi:hypothetical protein